MLDQVGSCSVEQSQIVFEKAQTAVAGATKHAPECVGLVTVIDRKLFPPAIPDSPTKVTKTVMGKKLLNKLWGRFDADPTKTVSQATLRIAVIPIGGLSVELVLVGLAITPHIRLMLSQLIGIRITLCPRSGACFELLSRSFVNPGHGQISRVLRN